MKTLKAQKLCNDAFRKYGVYQDLLNNDEMRKRTIMESGGAGGFYADLVALDFNPAGNLPTISMCHVLKKEKNVVNFLEYHQYTSEGLLPLDDDVLIYVGIPGRGELTVDKIECFLVPKGTFVKLNPLVVHGSQYPVNKDEAHIVCMLPGRTFKNDMVARLITDEAEMAELTV